MNLERRARIELATLAWKAKVIPFYERRINIYYIVNSNCCQRILVVIDGVEPPTLSV